MADTSMDAMPLARAQLDAYPDIVRSIPRPPAVPFKRSGLPRSAARPGAVPHECRRDRAQADAAERAMAEGRSAGSGSRRSARHLRMTPQARGLLR